MGLDVILNVVWVLTAVSSAVVLYNSPYRRGVALQAGCVCLIVAALFPVISATDDVIGIQHLAGLHASRHNPQDSRTTNHKKLPDSLIRLYEAVESGITAVPVGICFVCFFTVLFIVAFTLHSRKANICRNGRAPPLCLA